MRIERSRGVLALAAVLLLALFAGACGSDDDEESGGGGNKGTGIRAGEGQRTRTRAPPVARQPKEAGAKVDAGAQDGRHNQHSGGIESADRLQATMEQAANDLGWKSVPCDGAGDPAQDGGLRRQPFDRNVDAIVTIAIDTSLIKPVIAKAKSQGVPILQNAGESGDGYDASFYPSEEEKAEVLSDEIIKRLNSEVTEKPAELIIQDYPAPWAADRTEVLKGKVEGEPDIEIVADTQTDATQLLEYTRKTVTDQLTQNKDVDAFWFSFDATGQAGGPVIAKAYPGKKFPRAAADRDVPRRPGHPGANASGPDRPGGRLELRRGGLDRLRRPRRVLREGSSRSMPDAAAGVSRRRAALLQQDNHEGEPAARGRVRPDASGRAGVLPGEVEGRVRQGLLAGQGHLNTEE